MKITNIKLKKLQHIKRFLDLKLLFRTGSVYLAGGALQTLVNPSIKINDYDLFFKDAEYAKIAKALLEEVHKATKIFECPKGELTTYLVKCLDGHTMKIQLITKFYYNSMEDLINTFDFRAAMFAFDGVTLVTTRAAIHDAKKKRITINVIQFPVATLNRMIKYAARKKFHITPEAMTDFVMIVNLSRFDEDQLELYID